MPKTPAIHYNPSQTKGISRCGKKLAHLLWRTDPNDATCNLCIRLIAKDRMLMRSG